MSCHQSFYHITYMGQPCVTYMSYHIIFMVTPCVLHIMFPCVTLRVSICHLCPSLLIFGNLQNTMTFSYKLYLILLKLCWKYLIELFIMETFSYQFGTIEFLRILDPPLGRIGTTKKLITQTIGEVIMGLTLPISIHHDFLRCIPLRPT